MNIYLTSGTFDFLKKIKEKHSKETMLLMQNNESAVLLHETSKKTLFGAPRSYHVFESKGILENTGFIVFNHIPVIDEDQPLVEHRFKNNSSLFNSLPGSIALRCLKPVKSNNYIILTQWINEKSYLNWEQSPAYQTFFQETKSASAQTQMFMGSSYITKFYIPEKE